MQISGSVALITGANRGLGLAFSRELVRRGAAKVYGAARNPGAVTEPGVLPVALDITDGDQVERVAAQCADVSLLVNNAGVLRYSTFTSAPDLDAARQEMETNYFGTLRMCRAFAPVLAAAGGGAIVNMLSVTSFFTNPFDASYGASKAAEWSLTNGVRLELHHQGTLVVAVHAGFIDTEMAALASAPKISPESVAGQVFDAVEAGQVRCWPTSGPATSRPSCPATASSSTRPSRNSGTPRSAVPADPISIPPPQAMHLVCNRACWHGSRNTRGEAGRLPSWRRLSSATPAGRTSSWPPSCTVFTCKYASWKLSWPG
jgi:NAD(P)-dependent dehydrogenase (short-subunit alcohol dehydrogenase family)